MGSSKISLRKSNVWAAIWVHLPGGGGWGVGVLPYKGLMGTCSQPGYVFRDFSLKQGINFINFCLKQGIFYKTGAHNPVLRR